MVNTAAKALVRSGDTLWKARGARSNSSTCATQPGSSPPKAITDFADHSLDRIPSDVYDIVDHPAKVLICESVCLKC